MWIFWWCAPPKVTPLSCLFFVRPTIQTSTLLKVEAAYLHILEAKIFCIKNDSNDFQISCHLIFSFQLHFYEQLLLVDHFFPSAPHIFLCVKEEVVEEWHEKKRQKYLIFVQKYGTSHLSLRTPWTLIRSVLFECCAADTCWTKHTLSLLLQIKLYYRLYSTINSSQNNIQ